MLTTSVVNCTESCYTPMKPASFRAETVRRTCSIQGLKQHILPVRCFCQTASINPANSPICGMNNDLQCDLRVCDSIPGSRQVQEYLWFILSVQSNSPQWNTLTCISSTFKPESIFAYVSMLQSNEGGHSMLLELGSA